MRNPLAIVLSFASLQLTAQTSQNHNESAEIWYQQAANRTHQLGSD